jgi:plasmid stabilization system protein ParE
MRRIGEYIARDNPAAADKVLARIHEVIEHVAMFPDSGRATVEPGVEMALAPPHPYAIYFRYQVKRSTLTILRIRHTAQRRPGLRDEARAFAG